jgi:hypothetical protein
MTARRRRWIEIVERTSPLQKIPLYSAGRLAAEYL